MYFIDKLHFLEKQRQGNYECSVPLSTLAPEKNRGLPFLSGLINSGQSLYTNYSLRVTNLILTSSSSPQNHQINTSNHAGLEKIRGDIEPKTLFYPSPEFLLSTDH